MRTVPAPIPTWTNTWARRDEIMAFLRQDMREVTPAETSWAHLEALLSVPVAAPTATATAITSPHPALPPSPAAAADAYRAELGAGAR